MTVCQLIRQLQRMPEHLHVKVKCELHGVRGLSVFFGEVQTVRKKMGWTAYLSEDGMIRAPADDDPTIRHEVHIGTEYTLQGETFHAT